MKVPKILSAKDFPKKEFFDKKGSLSAENFNFLVQEYNNLALIVTNLARKDCMRLDRDE